MTPCSTCRGTGEVLKKPLAFGVFELERDGDLATVRCPTCQGLKKLPTTSELGSHPAPTPYELWAIAYLREHGMTSVRGRCHAVTQAMVKAFPELRRVPGWVVLPLGLRREHWWCVTSEGHIVDPTEVQFDDQGGVSGYIPWKTGDAVRVGRCMYCGEHIYAAVTDLAAMKIELPPGTTTCTCSEACSEALAKEFA